MTFAELQNCIYDDIDSVLSSSIKKLCDIYTTASNEICDCLKKYYSYYSSKDGKNMYFWGVNTGQYLHVKNLIDRAYRIAYDRACPVIYSCLRTILVNAYYETSYVHLWLGKSKSFTLLPKELIDVICNGSPRTVMFYNNVQGRTKDVFGDISYWKPAHNSVDSLLSGAYVNQDVALGNAFRTALLNNSPLASISNKVKHIVGCVDNNSTTGMLAKCIRVLRTDGMRCLSAGILASAFSVYGMYNNDVKKTWVTLKQNKNRDTTIDMLGTSIALRSRFRFPDGSLAMYPCMTGKAKYDVNTRCSILIENTSVLGSICEGINPLTGVEEELSLDYYVKWLNELRVC